MTLHIKLSEAFGTFCADGEKAAAYRYSHIDPFVDSHQEILMDFQGLRNMNSSFANALVANLVSQDPETAIDQMETHLAAFPKLLEFIERSST